ncbi:tRNA guanosine(34) transglycosylase Tgt [Candidatus Viadribacter manganicus]|uniref:Queuine tRNA-ribosyltransferase n=1 Tax=Candidatus Viadribacter manganicus TaxID=1759059 RepID=A0A1B1ADM1_9PROT|nr:tRNA guanosine(34) transglycosylase Tgt [Candidatus Viadribacter manganicus]ANP44657.1 queuine tRNA-ribosyltransferase [Candidatus Viadribacter manganicus]
MNFPFEIKARDGDARTGVLRTTRGDIRTPAFMPVGTAGTVKGLTVDQVASTGADIILGNTYHLMLRPGGERMTRLGGLHKFMRWDKPILTDSGGYQVMSLAQLRKLDADGVTFRSHVDGSQHRLTPESAMQIQADQIGADIVMQLDECPALPAPREDVEKAMRLSLGWAKRCKVAFGEREKQNLFAIVQGGIDPALRRISAEALVAEKFDGYAIGGLAVGEGHEAMLATLDVTTPLLPQDRPRYLMGVGKPIDIVESVVRGVDMFDCVLPTRSGRHGQAWTDEGPLNITNARYVEDSSPLDANIDCPASRDYSKAYLHHLFKAGELLGQVLLSWHNVAYYQFLMARLRDAIAEGRLTQFVSDFKAKSAAG